MYIFILASELRAKNLVQPAPSSTEAGKQESKQKIIGSLLWN